MAARLRGALVFVAAMTLVAAALWHGWPAMSHREEPGGLRVQDVGESLVQAPAAPASDRDPKSDGVQTAPLPPDDAPLAGILGPLAARADSGDRKAACRLAMELLRCEHLLDSASFADRPRSGPQGDDAGSSQPRNGVDEYLARERIWIGERLEQCEAVPDDLLDAGARGATARADAVSRAASGRSWAS